MAKKEDKKQSKEDKKQKKQKKQKAVRKKVLRSEYEKQKNQKINSLLGVPIDDETGFENKDKEPKSLWEKLFKDDEKELGFRRNRLMVIRGNESDIRERNKIKLSLPIVLLSEILSIIILCIYLLVIAKVAPPTNATDFMNIIFVIIAHFITTATLVGNDVNSNGLNFTLYSTSIAILHWVGASVIMFVMNSMYQPSMWGAFFFQLVLLLFVVTLTIILNMYKSTIIKTDIGYRSTVTGETKQETTEDKDVADIGEDETVNVADSTTQVVDEEALLS